MFFKKNQRFQEGGISPWDVLWYAIISKKMQNLEKSWKIMKILIFLKLSQMVYKVFLCTLRVSCGPDTARSLTQTNHNLIESQSELTGVTGNLGNFLENLEIFEISWKIMKNSNF